MRINQDALVNRQLFIFRDDGLVPNSDLPAIFYPAAVVFEGADEPHHMEALQAHVSINGWSIDWRGSVYRKVHYHSTAHETLVVHRGAAQLQLGGRRFGEFLKVKSGDVLALPAGVGHQRTSITRHFSVFGLYPDGQDWDLNWGYEKERGKRRGQADYEIPRVPPPGRTTYHDPIFGRGGPLMELWKK